MVRVAHKRIDSAPAKSPDAFRTISEVALALDVPQHVLRFWESKFSQIKPLKRGGGRRYYRPEDVKLLLAIRRLLYDDGYTIKGVQKILKDSGVKAILRDPKGPRATPAAPGMLEQTIDELLEIRQMLSVDKS
jgi:DNA-binding transcriptional MerR regulator